MRTTPGTIITGSVLLLLLLLLLLGASGCNHTVALAPQSATPGGATPAELLTRASAALQAGDGDELAMCFSADPKTGKSMAEMFLISKESEDTVIEGVKKFGARNFIEALGYPGMMLIYQGQPPFNLMVKKGKLTITDDKATYKYTVSAKGDEILPAQPELAKYMLALNGSSKTTVLSSTLEKVDDRWFLYAPNIKDATVIDKMHEATTDFVQQVEESIEACADAKALKTALIEPAATLNAALIKATTTKKKTAE